MARRIIATEDTLGGKPRLEGTGVSVEMILEDLSRGATTEHIVGAHEGLTREDVQTALAFAIGLVQGQAVGADAGDRVLADLEAAAPNVDGETDTAALLAAGRADCRSMPIEDFLEAIERRRSRLLLRT